MFIMTYKHFLCELDRQF